MIIFKFWVETVVSFSIAYSMSKRVACSMLRVCGAQNCGLGLAHGDGVHEQLGARNSNANAQHLLQYTIQNSLVRYNPILAPAPHWNSKECSFAFRNDVSHDHEQFRRARWAEEPGDPHQSTSSFCREKASNELETRMVTDEIQIAEADGLVVEPIACSLASVTLQRRMSFKQVCAARARQKAILAC